MKIRNGFVSNSSSSSFMIYGAYIENEDIYKVAAPLYTEAELAECGVDRVEDMDDFFYCLGDKIEGFDFFGSYDDDGRYIGASWDTIKDDETGAQFKARVEAAIRKHFGDGIKCGTHSKIVYN